MMAKYYTKPQYNNLPAHLAQQLAALPPLPAPGGRRRGHHQQPVIAVSAYILYYKNYNTKSNI